MLSNFFNSKKNDILNTLENNYDKIAARIPIKITCKYQISGKEHHYRLKDTYIERENMPTIDEYAEYEFKINKKSCISEYSKLVVPRLDVIVGEEYVSYSFDFNPIDYPGSQLITTHNSNGETKENFDGNGQCICTKYGYKIDRNGEWIDKRSSKEEDQTNDGVIYSFPMPEYIMPYVIFIGRINKNKFSKFLDIAIEKSIDFCKEQLINSGHPDEANDDNILWNYALACVYYMIIDKFLYHVKKAYLSHDHLVTLDGESTIDITYDSDKLGILGDMFPQNIPINVPENNLIECHDQCEFTKGYDKLSVPNLRYNKTEDINLRPFGFKHKINYSKKAKDSKKSQSTTYVHTHESKFTAMYEYEFIPQYRGISKEMVDPSNIFD